MKIMIVFQCLLELQKIDFLTKHGPSMARFWLPRWPQVGSKMGSKPAPKRSRKRGRLQNRFWVDFGSIFCRFGVDFGSSLVDFGMIFGRIWVDRLVLAGYLLAFLIYPWHLPGVRWVFYLLAKCPH